MSRAGQLWGHSAMESFFSSHEMLSTPIQF